MRGLLDQDCLSFKLKEEANSNQTYSDSSFNESLSEEVSIIYSLDLLFEAPIGKGV